MITTTAVTTPLSLADYEALARGLLEQPTWDYFAGGSADEVTLRANREALERVRLRPRVLANDEPVTTTTTALGTPIDFPCSSRPPRTTASRMPTASAPPPPARATPERSWS